MILNYKALHSEELKRYIPVQPRRRGNQGTKKKRYYKDIVCAFDIETTRLDEKHSIMYIWQFQLGLNGDTIIGRSWKECMRWFRTLAAACGDNEYFVIYVHNLSFEFQFLSGQYPFTNDEVFAVESRKILKCDMFNHLEFRCSYLHSNMSLREYLKKMGVEDQKQENFNYDLKRYPWTPLSDEELKYCINDVKGLVEALSVEMDHDNDNLYTVPLTSTGYVRRDVKAAMRRISPFYVKDQLPDWETYTLLREAFRGGNTHANRYFSGKIIENVKSADRSSSYPDTECNDIFPVGAFRSVQDPTPEKLRDLMIRRKKAILCRIVLWNVELRDRFWGCPYLAIDKCRNIVGGSYDNGRILRADYLETTVTDIDLKIIMSEYAAEMDVITLQYAKYGKLPSPLVNCIQYYYRRKTELKGVQDQEIYYTKNKNKLNSVYGMSAQNPVKSSILYNGGSFDQDDSISLPELLEQSNKRAFFPYQWGVWCTAWARYRLEEGIRFAHGKGAEFIYCDTDSVKYVGDIDWTAYNNERMNCSIESGSYADDPKGNRHYMGVYEYEGMYEQFATRGAKKYAYVQNSVLHIAIAGVNKEKGAAELNAAGGINAFLLPEFTFRDGETEAVYVDHIRKFVWIDGHMLRIAPCVTIRPSMKTLSDTAEYEELIKDAQAFRDLIFDKYGEK